MTWANVNYTFYDFYELGIFIYALVIMGAYFILGLFSFRKIAQYRHRINYAESKTLLHAQEVPGVSILAPAYNEEETIVHNIKSLMAVHYADIELIVVNDGSKDHTLQKCIEAFNLVKVPFLINESIETQPVLGVYKSTIASLSKLTVVDKENGGKSDALNCAINVSSKPYITCIDVDCILDQVAMTTLVKPFLQATKKRVIATGGVVRVANSCEIHDGFLQSVEVPKKLIPRFQALEYIRAFLLGRMAWSYLDGLILISGAIGVFDKEIAIAAGGYDLKTVGEDMEIVVRMRKYMHKIKEPYEVAFVPDPLCWTEVPETWDALGKQRNRWTRGTIETLVKHKALFFNPRYKLIGLLSYPYWFFFEWLAPILEFIGVVLTIVLFLLGRLHTDFFLLMLVLVYSYAIFFSLLGLLAEEVSFRKYKSGKDIWRLIIAALLEPILYHPFLVIQAIMGNIDYIRGKKSWEKTKRKGFSANK